MLVRRNAGSGIAATCLAVVLVACSGSGGGSPTPRPTPLVATAHIGVGDLTRDYTVVTPADIADRESVPLLVVLHGATQTMADAQGWGYDEAAGSAGAVVVYPQAVEVTYDEGRWTAWNAGNQPDTGTDDLTFISDLIDRMGTEYSIDPNRIYLAGASNGGQMAYRAACELSDRIAAVADLSGALLVECDPGHPISVIDIHGSDDDQIPVAGGGKGCGTAGCPPLADTMERWRQIDGCTGEPTETTENLAAQTTYASCQDETAVTFMQAFGVGHDLANIQIDVPAVTWEFLMSHPRAAGSS